MKISSYNKFSDESQEYSDNIDLNEAESPSGYSLINKRIQSQSPHLVLVGDILEEKDDSGNTVLTGEVKNVGNQRADFAKIFFTFRISLERLPLYSQSLRIIIPS